MALLIVFTLPLTAPAQHNGDAPAFQGFSNAGDVGVRALGMGGAFTAMTGDVSALFTNPAGLMGIDKLQLTVSFKSSKYTWWENQVYWGSRYFHSGNFILDGMIDPNPTYDGVWADTLYYFNPNDFTLPKGGDEYSKDNADWEYPSDNFGLNNIAVALPLGERLVIAASYNRMYNVHVYDRNDTYLDPHFGHRADPRVQEAYNDTLHMGWWQFDRARTGGVKAITGGVGFKLTDIIQLGLGVNYISGETDDAVNMDKWGTFDLVYSGTDKYRFFHETQSVQLSGTSKFSGLGLRFGTVFTFEKFNLGMDLRLPHTLEREWSYTVTENDGENSSSGTDKLKMPLSFSFGVVVKPVNKVTLSFDLENNPYSDAEFEFADESLAAAHRGWADQNSYRFGIEFRPVDFLSLRAGYRNVSQVFVPQGAPYRDRGPSLESLTIGASVNIFYGRLDVAYECGRLGYYDLYENNQNFASERRRNIIFGYTFILP